MKDQHKTLSLVKQLLAIFTLTLCFLTTNLLANQLQSGQQVEAEWRGYWYPATLVKQEGKRWQVDFNHFAKPFSTWVAAKDIRAFAEKPAASQPIILPQHHYKIKERVKVKWRNSWYSARILDHKDKQWKVRFIGFSRDNEQWVKADLIRPENYTKPQYTPEKHYQPLNLKKGDKIMAEWHGKWYPATIIEAEKDRWKIHYIGYDNYWDEWVNSGRVQLFEKNTALPQHSALPQHAIHAVKNNDVKTLAALLKTKAVNINATDEEGASLLQIAAKNDNLAMAKFLIEHGAKIDQKDPNDQTALLWAADHWNWDMVKYFLEHGAKPNESRAVLFYAIQADQRRIVKLLVEKGINITNPFHSGITPLQLAKNFDRKRIIYLLKQGGATH